MATIRRAPVVVDGVRYSTVVSRRCDGCAAYSVEFDRRQDLCTKLKNANEKANPVADGCAAGNNYESVIWLTDADYAVHRLTQGDPP